MIGLPPARLPLRLSVAVSYIGADAGYSVSRRRIAGRPSVLFRTFVLDLEYYRVYY